MLPWVEQGQSQRPGAASTADDGPLVAVGVIDDEALDDRGSAAAADPACSAGRRTSEERDELRRLRRENRLLREEKQILRNSAALYATVRPVANRDVVAKRCVAVNPLG